MSGENQTASLQWVLDGSEAKVHPSVLGATVFLARALQRFSVKSSVTNTASRATCRKLERAQVTRSNLLALVQGWSSAELSQGRFVLSVES